MNKEAREKEEAFFKAWAKLASRPFNQVKCFMVQGAIYCKKYPWYGKNEKECYNFIKEGE